MNGHLIVTKTIVPREESRYECRHCDWRSIRFLIESPIEREGALYEARAHGLGTIPVSG